MAFSSLLKIKGCWVFSLFWVYVLPLSFVYEFPLRKVIVTSFSSVNGVGVYWVRGRGCFPIFFVYFLSEKIEEGVPSPSVAPFFVSLSLQREKNSLHLSFVLFRKNVCLSLPLGITQLKHTGLPRDLVHHPPLIHPTGTIVFQ